uniref:Pectinesterase n=1 Tax=Kalanchoe fedtschenkoi TaxID=63787 RepID=A0A7N0T1V0_KALFE
MSSCSNMSLNILFSLAFLVSVVRLGAAGGNVGNTIDVIDAPLLTQKISTNRSIIVDAAGNGEFTSIQAAVDSVPEGNSKWIIVHVRKGVYGEKVHIPKHKPYIFMRGNGRGRTVVVWSQSSEDNIESATLRVEAKHFVAFGISFKNDAPTGVAYTSQNQSVAAFVGADKVAFYHCAFFSAHNTLFDYKGRHYYDDCYIQGSVDFIFGRARSLFHNCELFVISDKRIEILGSIAAQNRQSEDDESGFVFNKGKIYGIDQVYLGRVKSPYSRVLFANMYMSKTIEAKGWTGWRYDGSLESTYLAEYRNSGQGSIADNRVSWAKQLSDEEAAPLLSVDFIHGEEWLPAWL